MVRRKPLDKVSSDGDGRRWRDVALHGSGAIDPQMTSLISHKSNQGFHRVVSQHNEFVGVYVFDFETETATVPVL